MCARRVFCATAVCPWRPRGISSAANCWTRRRCSWYSAGSRSSCASPLIPLGKCLRPRVSGILNIRPPQQQPPLRTALLLPSAVAVCLTARTTSAAAAATATASGIRRDLCGCRCRCRFRCCYPHLPLLNPQNVTTGAAFASELELLPLHLLLALMINLRSRPCPV